MDYKKYKSIYHEQKLRRNMESEEESGLKGVNHIVVLT